MYTYFSNHNKDELQPRHWWNWRFKLLNGDHDWKKWGLEINSWSGFRFSLGLSSDIDDNMWVLDLGIIFFTIYLKFRHPYLPQAVDTINGYDDRELKLSISDWTVYLVIWEKENHWSISDKRRWNFDIKTFLLGNRQYEAEDIKTVEMLVTFPEGEYKVNFRFFVSRWWRDRWPFKESLLRCEMNCEEGIPVPGKGENSWDCGNSKTYGLTCPVKTTKVGEAMGLLIKSVFETRSKYGSGPDMYKEKAC